MRKSTGRIKRAIALFLVVLMSIESFAAVVSDNDGAAFITKAEFDSLKNDFQSQINRYNESIDNKIDGAISLYIRALNVSSKETLANATSNLTYPLTLQMKNIVLDFSKWNTNNIDIPYYTPSMKTDWSWTRYDQGTWRVHVTPERRINWFFDGNYNNSIDKYILRSRLKNMDILWSVAGCFYVLAEYTMTRNDAAYNIAFMLDSKTRKNRGNMGAGWITRDNEWAEFELKYLSKPGVYTGDDCPFVVDAFYEWSPISPQGQDRFETTQVDNDPYRKIRFNTSKSDNWYEGKGIENYELSISQTYDDVGIDFLINANASDKSIEVPVAYDKNVYFVNKYNFKQDLLKEYTTPLRDQSNYASYNHRCYHILSTGFTIEPQTSTNIKSSKWERSLLEPKDIVYVVTTPISRERFYQQMTGGILVSEISKDANYGKIKLDISSSDSAVTKYLVMSDKPIEITNTSEISSANESDFFILSNDETFGNNKSFVLNEGVNEVFFTNSDLKKNTKLYFKIIWTDGPTPSKCIINSEPELNIQIGG